MAPVLSPRTAPGHLPLPAEDFIARPEALKPILATIRRHGLVSITGPAGTGKSQLVQDAGRTLQNQRSGLRILYQELAPGFNLERLSALLALAMGARAGAATDDALVAMLAEAPTLLILDRIENLGTSPGSRALLGSQLDRWLERVPQLHVLLSGTTPLDATTRNEYRIEAPRLSREECETLIQARLARTGRGLPADPSSGEYPWVGVLDALHGEPLALRMVVPMLTALPESLPALMTALAATRPASGQDSPSAGSGLLQTSLNWVLSTLQAWQPATATALYRLAASFPAGLPEAIALSVIGTERGDGRPACEQARLEQLQTLNLVERRDGRILVPPGLQALVAQVGQSRSDRPEHDSEATLFAYADYLDSRGQRSRNRAMPLQGWDWLLEEMTLERLVDRYSPPSHPTQAPISPVARIAGACRRAALGSGRSDTWERLLIAGLSDARARGDRPGEANTLKCLGDLHRHGGRLDEAASAYNQALYCYGKLNDLRGRAETLRAQGELLLSRGQDEHAENAFRQSLIAGRSAKCLFNETETLTDLGNFCLSRNRQGEAENCFRQALPIARQLENPCLESNILKGMAELAMHAGRQDEAAAACRRALALWPAFEDPRGEAVLHRMQGDLARKRDQADEANSSYCAAIALFRQCQDLSGCAATLESQAELHASLCDEGKAEAARVEALSLYRQTGDVRGEARILTAQGHLDYRGARLDEAEARYDEASKLYLGTDDLSGRAWVLKALGDLDVQRSHFGMADGAYREALALFRQAGNQEGQATALRAHAELYRQRFRPEDAEPAYRNALSLYHEIGDKGGEAAMHTALAELHRSRGESGEAESSYLRALPLYRQARDSRSEAHTWRALGNLLLLRGDLDKAEHALREALQGYRNCRDSLGEVNTLTALGQLWQRRQCPDQAQAAFGEAEEIRRRLNAGARDT